VPLGAADVGPQAVVVQPTFAKYHEASEAMFAILHDVSPLVEPLSIDEAFVDVTGTERLFGPADEVARGIKRRIKDTLRVTASVGVAPNKFVAKIASDMNKPDGLTIVPADRVQETLDPLPIERMWGVGPKTAARLRAAGLGTIGDLGRADPALLETVLGSWGADVRTLARGIDDRAVQPGYAAKSVGAEETFADDLTTRDALERRLLDQAGRVARRLLADDLCGRTVVVKVKYADFTLRTRRATLAEPVADTDSIYQAARRLLDRFALERRRVRLTGVAVAGLQPGPPPRSLFPDEAAERRYELERVAARVTDRFGEHGLVRATLLDGGKGGR
jgi:DNA polymerase-4